MKLRKHCIFKISATGLGVILLFFAGMTGSGCALSPATKCLGEIIEKEIGSQNDPYARYRCSAGAHRGDSVRYTENTLDALKAANEDQKYAFVEFDVQYSKDEKIVVFHDNRLLRIFASLRTIGNTSFEKLVNLTDGEIASYDAVMDVLRDKKINIEIKSRGDLDKDMRLADQVIADIRARNRDNDVMISSISPDVIRYVSRTYPDIPTGQIFWRTASTYLHFDPLTERLFREIADTRADYLLLHVDNLRNLDSLITLKPHDKTIIFWDFDDAIYVVHQHFSDRLWGESGIRTMVENIRYMMFLPFYCHTPDVQRYPVLSNPGADFVH